MQLMCVSEQFGQTQNITPSATPALAPYWNRLPAQTEKKSAAWAFGAWELRRRRRAAALPRHAFDVPFRAESGFGFVI